MHGQQRTLQVRQYSSHSGYGGFAALIESIAHFCLRTCMSWHVHRRECIDIYRAVAKFKMFRTGSMGIGDADACMDVEAVWPSPREGPCWTHRLGWGRRHRRYCPARP